ncbi:MAG: universal stress protein [Chloroflexi bacterium]|nr:universal stress protein [Chloroflexota bacterium]
MREKILVPLDGSALAEMSIPYAEEIVSKLGGEITFVSVAESNAADVINVLRTYLRVLSAQVNQELQDWTPRGDVSAQSKLLVGKVSDEILRNAGESKVDIIVMASRGGTGGGPSLLGSVGARIIRAAVGRVLIIRVPASEDAIKGRSLLKKILVPLDGSKLGEGAVSSAAYLARALGSELMLFRAVRPIVTWSGPGKGKGLKPEERKPLALAYLEEVARPLRESGLKVSCMAEIGKAAEQIIDIAKTGYDLIAISSHGRSAAVRWPMGSVAEKVTHSGDRPILLVRQPKERLVKPEHEPTPDRL